MDKSKLTVNRIARIALFTAILFVQEEALSFIPNVQFTQALIAIYYFGFGLVDTLLIVSIHVFLDNLFMGSLSLLYTPAMFVGWISLVLILHLFRKIKNKWIISTIVGLHGILYSWCFVFVSCVIYKIPFEVYIIPDIPFEIILLINGFVTTLVLLEPLTNLIKKYLNKPRDNNSYCGYNCKKCPLYKNKQSNQCVGCKSKKCTLMKNECFIRNCAINKKVTSCGYCNEFPCSYLDNNISKETMEYLKVLNKNKNTL